MFRDHSIVYNINQGETSHTISYARSKKKSEMISDIRRKIAVCNARLQNKFGNFTKEELVKIGSEKRRLQRELESLETRCVSHKVKRTYKKVLPEKIKAYVLKEIEFAKQNGRNWIFAEDIARIFQVKTHDVKQVLQQLNIEGILHQPTHRPLHDCSRDRPWGFKGYSGWMADIYYFRQNDEESEEE